MATHGIRLRLEGKTPLIMHRFSDAAAQSTQRGSKVANQQYNQGTPREQAETSLYLDSSGALVIPQPNIMASIVGGGQYHKLGRSQVTTRERSLVVAALDIPSVCIPLIASDWEVDSRPVVIPATKGRVIRHRPRFDTWALEFDAEIDANVMPVDLMQEVIESAGRLVGLGDYRPARKGPYGRYFISMWEVQDFAKVKAQPEPEKPTKTRRKSSEKSS